MRSLRVEARHEVKSVAEALGVTASTVSQFERTEHPNVETVERFLAALGMRLIAVPDEQEREKARADADDVANMLDRVRELANLVKGQADTAKGASVGDRLAVAFRLIESLSEVVALNVTATAGVLRLVGALIWSREERGDG